MSFDIPLFAVAIVVFIIGLNQAYMGKWWGWLLMVGGGGYFVYWLIRTFF